MEDCELFLLHFARCKHEIWVGIGIGFLIFLCGVRQNPKKLKRIMAIWIPEHTECIRIIERKKMQIFGYCWQICLAFICNVCGLCKTSCELWFFLVTFKKLAEFTKILNICANNYMEHFQITSLRKCCLCIKQGKIRFRV